MGLSGLKILIHEDFLDNRVFIPVFAVVDHLDDVIRRIFGGTAPYSGFLCVFFNVLYFACRSRGSSCMCGLAFRAISAEMSVMVRHKTLTLSVMAMLVSGT